MSSCIGISLGDVTGIGPEVTLKALATELATEATRYLILGDPAVVQRTNQQLGLGLTFGAANSAARLRIFNPTSNSLPANLPAGAPAAAQAAVAALREGARRCLAGELAALVTAPVNKDAIVRAGHPGFVGQTEFLSELAGAKRTAMILLGHDERGRWLRVALVTTHLPLKEVAAAITPDRIRRAVELAAESCRLLNLPHARLAVCGLNPHAGENGQMGTEEQTTISPTLEALRADGFTVAGPLSGDTVFYHALRGEYDAVVAMYHDQGLAPLKAVAFDSGINWTLGLPFIRTSPDHGTAYNLAGKGSANPSSMVAALRLAKQLASRQRAPHA